MCDGRRAAAKKNSNKSSAVAEMGDRLATIGMGRKLEGCCAAFRGDSGVLI